jgi:hypothetical protein
MSERRKLWNLLYVLIVLLLAAGIVAVVCLSCVPLTKPRREASESDLGPLRCTLEPWPDRTGEDPPDLRLQLTNTSERPVTIWYRTWPHAHVLFLFRDDAGRIVAQFHFGSLSSRAFQVDDAGRPTTPLPTLRLEPGESYSAGIHLNTLADNLDVPPGRCRVEAVFTYADLGGWPEPHQHFVARSGAVTVEVGESGPGANKPVWRLPL